MAADVQFTHARGILVFMTVQNSILLVWLMDCTMFVNADAEERGSSCRIEKVNHNYFFSNKEVLSIFLAQYWQHQILQHNARIL